MKSSYSTLMQSRFFNPAFNSAIFHGPVRIYFSQSHESLALKIYFTLQQQLLELMERAKQLHQLHGKNILIMIYPDTEAFQLSFEGSTQFLNQDGLEEDTIIGINGPFEDDKLEIIVDSIRGSVLSWAHANALQLAPAPI